MQGGVTGHDAGSLSKLDRQAISFIKPGGNWQDLPEDFPSARVKQIRAAARLGTGTRSSYYGRLDWDDSAATIATYFVRPGNGTNIHPQAPRTLTFREAARLQGFQDTVRFHGRQRARAMQIGNAMPPPVAACVAGALPARGWAVELFAGAGGFAAGADAAGFDLLIAADHDEDALHTLASHLSPRLGCRTCDLSHGDVQQALAREIGNALGDGRVALVAGGPPCQGFSTAGNNRLSEDPRNELPDAFLRFIREVHPRQVLFENVAALTWKSRRPWFDSFLRQLSGLGYAVAWRLVHCEAFGLPQRRRRVVVVGTDPTLPAFTFPSGPFRILDPAYRSAAQPEIADAPLPPTVRDAIGDLPLVAASDDREEVPLGDDGNSTPYRRYVRGEMNLMNLLNAQRCGP